MFTRTPRDSRDRRISVVSTAGAALAACTVAAVGSAQTFNGLGLPPGTTSSASRAVSADGSVVVGDGGPAFAAAGFRWTSAGGMQSLGTFAGGTYSFAPGVSDDGQVVTGYGDTPSGQRAYRWTSAGGMVDIGALPGAIQVLGSDASADGSVLVGTCNATGGYRAYRWTSSDGMVSLGTLPGGAISFGYGVNSDGSVVVGDSYSTIGDVAFRWTEAGGMQNLGTLTGGTFSYAYAVSADGSVVVGDSDSTGGDVSYRWTASGGMVSLGIPSGGFSYMVSNGVSADGSVIVGGVVGPPDTAFLWSAPIGLVDLNVYLPAIGINLAGWTLTEAGGVSADGRTVVGTGIHNGVEEAWIATLPGTSAISFCFGDGTGTACPCANTGNVGHGCDNRQPTGTGGALLGGSGLASLSGDALTLNVVNSLDHVHVLFEGTQNTGFLRYGAGLRCVRGGTNGSGQSFLKRLEQGTPTGGGISFSGVSLASSSKGAPLVPGETYDYYVAYRDAEMNGAPGCPGFAFGFNSTNACAVTWSP